MSTTTPRDQLKQALALHLAAKAALEGAVLAHLLGKEITVDRFGGKYVGLVTEGLTDEGEITVRFQKSGTCYGIPLTAALIDLNPHLDFAPAKDWKQRAESTF